MSRFDLRQKPRICYSELDEPSFDEYEFCDKCRDYVYDYCSIHGPPLVIPDDKPSTKKNVPSFVPRAALTIPQVFLHIAPSIIAGAGLGVFSTLTLPRGVRFGPYRGEKTMQVDSNYCWQIYDRNNKPAYAIDAADANKSNWMRYVNCARHSSEQNLVAYQFRGQMYYRTIKIIPRFTELMVFYGSEFAHFLNVDLRRYNSPLARLPPLIEPLPKKPRIETPKENTEPGTAYRYPENAQLQRHLRNVHSDVRIHECGICDYKTNDISNLNNHLRIHTGEKSYSCSLCDYKCSRKGNLERHSRIHTGEKPYSCSLCDYKCSVKSSLNVHSRIHTGEKPYSCSLCDYKCNVKSNLNVHSRIHTGEKPYSCSLCDYKCNVKSNLKNHSRIHTGEKPYACSECDYKCTGSSNLKKHLRMRH